MSRVSRKSELSPSVTRGGGNIDLGKNSGVEMGQKSQPSITSGGIGVTQEITSVGGATVSGGIEIDVTPVDFGINVDPSGGTISVSGGAEVPGGLLGVSGGIEVDLNTGEITGGSIGGEIGGLGINLSNSKKGGLGIEFTVQIPGTPIELSLGFGFPPKEEPTRPPGGSGNSGGSDSPRFTMPTLDPNCWYDFFIIGLQQDQRFENCVGYTSSESGQGWGFERELIPTGKSNSKLGPPVWNEEFQQYGPVIIQKTPIIGYVEIRSIGYARPVLAGGDIIPRGGVNTTIHDGVQIGGNITIPYVAQQITARGRQMRGDIVMRDLPLILASWPFYSTDGTVARYWDVDVQFLKKCPGDERPELVVFDDPPAENNRFPPFPNPPPRKQKKMDACCQENLKFLRAIYTRLGLAKFPGKLPSTIIQEVSKEGEAPAEPPQVPIADLTDLLMWQFERDDERWGQWQVQIDIKDSDITQEGDQKKSIKLPNLAESIAEFEGQLLSIMTNVDALVALQVKNLAESGMARQEAIKGYLASKAIIKYMAFKSIETDVPVPMTFTAGAETISKLLEESEGHIKGTDYVEKETLRDVYLDLLQAAAIIRAVHWQKIDTKTDTKSQLLNILKGSVNLAASITKPQTSNENGETFDPDKNFEDFIDSVEDGFRNVTGIADAQNPYGKSPNRRPRIRQIGDNISQAGGSD